MECRPGLSRGAEPGGLSEVMNLFRESVSFKLGPLHHRMKLEGRDGHTVPGTSFRSSFVFANSDDGKTHTLLVVESLGPSVLGKQSLCALGRSGN